MPATTTTASNELVPLVSNAFSSAELHGDYETTAASSLDDDSVVMQTADAHRYPIDSSALQPVHDGPTEFHMQLARSACFRQFHLHGMVSACVSAWIHRHGVETLYCADE